MATHQKSITSPYSLSLSLSLSLGTLNKGLPTSPETSKLPINTNRLIGLKITLDEISIPYLFD